jgi:hypothetical protein
MWTCGTTAGFPGARVRLASPVLRTEPSCLQTNGHTHLARVRVANGPSNGPERVRHPRAAAAGQGGIIVWISRAIVVPVPDRRTGRPVPHGRYIRTPGVRMRCQSHMPSLACADRQHGSGVGRRHPMPLPRPCETICTQGSTGFRTQLPTALASAGRTCWHRCHGATRASRRRTGGVEQVWLSFAAARDVFGWPAGSGARRRKCWCR